MISMAQIAPCLRTHATFGLVIGIILAIPTLGINLSLELLDVEVSIYLANLSYVVFFV